MPVDKAELKERIREIAGDDPDFARTLEEKLASNDAVATQFIAGFMRHKDYTTKTQALATDRQTMDQERRTWDGQIQQYRQLLEQTEQEKGQILRDLANHKVSVATAHARLKDLKTRYQLSDDDVPSIPDQIET